MALGDAGLYSRVRQLLPEMLKFGLVGGIGAVFDLGGAALLHGKYHVEPLAAKGISTGVAMVITYLGSRFWTFKDRENQELKREAALFIVLNLVGLLIAEAGVGIVTYGLGQHGQIAYNIGSFLGTGFGTIFRYVTYRKWVFLAPDEGATAMAAPEPQPFPDYPPWELDPDFLGASLAPAAPAPAGPAFPAPAPAYSSPWEQESDAAWDPALAPTMSWSPPVLQAAPVPESSAAPWQAPAPEPGFAAPAPGFAAPTPDFPAAAMAAPVQETRRPKPAAVHETRRPKPAPSPVPRSSGGRHRKS
jgi:putative flippase GtrA